ncbi:acyltransferase family protein [Pontibacter liquoris]|uniref:acyltransferase family protein n=1 Tax=Pontibacter liquoris TaxID=2905677 RepID=UPI001FA70E0B|nr:acyltransferase family protein [Pontibacter liquoris]
MTEHSKPKLDFRYDINALRAVAIVGVLLFHYKISIFQGGYTGVDVFFVISGYLMSRIIVRSISKNEFSFKDYLSKRLQRIVPALLFLVTILTLAGFFLYLPQAYKLNEQNAAASVLFLSNVLYWQHSSYFDPASDLNILLHTWSLSVEWQFYLLYPAVLLLFHKVFKTRLPYIFFFVSTTLLIAFLSFRFTETDPTASFYLFPTRSWEMLCGGIAFFTEGRIKSYQWRKALAIVGYMAIAASFIFLDTTLPWPGIYTLLPVAATFLVIIADYSELPLIKHNGIQFIGRISYSLYLWHWPVFVLAQYFGLGAGLVAVTCYTLLSLILGYISYKYVEPRRFVSSKPLFAAMAILFLGTASLAYFKANRFLYKEETIEMEAYQSTHTRERDVQYWQDTCHVSDMEDYDQGRCLCIEEGKKNILLLGDSHMGQLSQSIRERLEDRGIHILQATASGTFPTLRHYEGEVAMVRPLMDYIFKGFIPKNASKIDGVILTASWAGKSSISRDSILSGIQEAQRYFRKYNLNTIVIGQTDRYTIPYPTIAARDLEYSSNTGHRFLDDYAYELDKYLSKHLGPSYIRVINTSSFPRLSPQGAPYMADDHHVTSYGANLIVSRIFENPEVRKFLGLHKKTFAYE